MKIAQFENQTTWKYNVGAKSYAKEDKKFQGKPDDGDPRTRLLTFKQCKGIKGKDVQ